MRGRKPKPTVIKDLHGSREPRNAAEPRPSSLLADGGPPAHFNADMVGDWNYALEHSPPGMLKQIDRSALEVWVVAHSLHRSALIEQLKVGLVMRSPVAGVPIQSPFLAIINRQALIMLKAATELGFTPVSRPRVVMAGAIGGASLGGAPDAQTGREDSLDAYLAGAPGAAPFH